MAFGRLMRKTAQADWVLLSNGGAMGVTHGLNLSQDAGQDAAQTRRWRVQAATMWEWD